MVPFLNFKPLKLQLRVFLASHTVAMVTYYVMERTTTYSPIVGKFFWYHDCSIKWQRVAITTHQNLSAGNCWSHLNAYSLCKYLLTPIPHSHQIQDGSSIGKFALSHPKYTCIAGYTHSDTVFPRVCLTCVCFVLLDFVTKRCIYVAQKVIYMYPFLHKIPQLFWFVVI